MCSEPCERSIGPKGWFGNFQRSQGMDINCSKIMLSFRELVFLGCDQEKFTGNPEISSMKSWKSWKSMLSGFDFPFNHSRADPVAMNHVAIGSWAHRILGSWTEAGSWQSTPAVVWAVSEHGLWRWDVLRILGEGLKKVEVGGDKFLKLQDCLHLGFGFRHGCLDFFFDKNLGFHGSQVHWIQQNWFPPFWTPHSLNWWSPVEVSSIGGTKNGWMVYSGQSS